MSGGGFVGARAGGCPQRGNNLSPHAEELGPAGTKRLEAWPQTGHQWRKTSSMRGNVMYG